MHTRNVPDGVASTGRAALAALAALAAVVGAVGVTDGALAAEVARRGG